MKKPFNWSSSSSSRACKEIFQFQQQSNIVLCASDLKKWAIKDVLVTSNVMMCAFSASEFVCRVGSRFLRNSIIIRIIIIIISIVKYYHGPIMLHRHCIYCQTLSWVEVPAHHQSTIIIRIIRIIIIIILSIVKYYHGLGAQPCHTEDHPPPLSISLWQGK